MTENMGPGGGLVLGLWERLPSRHRSSSPNIYLSLTASEVLRFSLFSLVTPVFLRPYPMRGCWNIRDLAWTCFSFCRDFLSPEYSLMQRDLPIIFETSTRDRKSTRLNSSHR